MTKLEALQEFALSKGIAIYGDLSFGNLSCAVQMNGACAIAINREKVETEALETVCTAHELGHCMTWSFYQNGTPVCTHDICENRANKWAIKKLIPKDELVRALNEGSMEEWEMADYFGVSPEFMHTAIKFYTRGWV